MRYRNSMMREFAGLGTPPKKTPFQKSKAVLELERLANEQARKDHPTMDAKFLAPRTFRDDTANDLTKCIVEYITLSGGFASRINNQGTYSRKLGKYIRGTSKKGLADVMATFRGFSLHIEVKIGRDIQSEAQKRTESEVNRSGGLYFIAKDFQSFKNWLDNI
jgi:hypothetical protein